MPELRVVAVSNDGTRLVLKAADSTEYTLPIDERLRAAVRNDRARLGQIEIEVESHLRPRDIQARIRAGASAEEVAQLAGIPVDRVRRFEGPVLAERAFMAERARKTPVRRPGENTGPQLGEAVAERLLLRGADKDSVQWDSWRRDDGTWEVLLVYRVATEPHSASWTYDPPRRLVQAVDDEARALIGEADDTPEPSFPFVPRIARLPRDRPLDRTLDRHSERGERGAQAGGEDDARGAEEATGERERDSLTSLLEAVPSFRGDMVVPESAKAPQADEESEAEVEEPPAPAASAGAGSAYADVLMPRAVAGHRDRLTGTTDRQAEADGVRPGRRAAVPSWDEIVFGTRRKKPE
ncbi:DNA-binding protein [Streptomyces nigrescens]|uniref:DNA-binding protein n=2 Tax=Streptomyces TaxID=1883 RepID=A0ABM7ZZF5_STRNI|nr:septation protein SepH [Streptomyces nigrescens]MEE4422630.1 septation protein SepH [Streptomyces sp. DSM 41528]BDM71731.1 DNA-binding protein [Streptomyces nigrescens]